MTARVAGRLLLSLPVLLAVMTLTFFATVTAPGDPLASLLPYGGTPEQYAQAAREYGLDRPLYEQWLLYMGRTASGNLGVSLRTGQPVANDLRAGIAATFELAAFAFVIMVPVGVGVGVVTAVRPGSVVDHLLSVFSIGGVAAPIFWTALMLQLLFYGQLHWLPAGGRIDDSLYVLNPFPRATGFYLIDSLAAGNLEAFANVLKHLLLPAAVLAYRALGVVVRVTRAAMIEQLTAQYTQTARAFGARPRRVVWRHAFPNALPPILTVLGLAFGDMLAGSVLIETIFNWPGLGRYTATSILTLDYAGVIGASLVLTVIYVFANLLVDLSYPIVDPRQRSR